MNGIINVVKPPNMTSQDVVSYLRGLLGERRIGHGGTLDPGAAGVLPVFLGKSTRLCEYSIGGDKEYLGEISFGKSTDTQDSYGNVIASGDCTVTKAMVQQAFSSLTGEISQQVPMYSAIKVGGQKLYQIARKGKSVDAPVRKVTIHRLKVLSQTGENKFLFSVLCSKGTYVRTLCTDAAALLGCCGHLSFLLRTRVGIFGLNDGCTLNEIRSAKENGTLRDLILPPDGAVQHLTAMDLKSKARRFLLNGAAANVSFIKGSIPKEGELCRIYINGEFAGLGSVTADGVRMNKLLMEEHHESMG